jgi:hypothetical protein
MDKLRKKKNSKSKNIRLKKKLVENLIRQVDNQRVSVYKDGMEKIGTSIQSTGSDSVSTRYAHPRLNNSDDSAVSPKLTDSQERLDPIHNSPHLIYSSTMDSTVRTSHIINSSANTSIKSGVQTALSNLISEIMAARELERQQGLPKDPKLEELYLKLCVGEIPNVLPVRPSPVPITERPPFHSQHVSQSPLYTPPSQQTATHHPVQYSAAPSATYTPGLGATATHRHLLAPGPLERSSTHLANGRSSSFGTTTSLSHQLLVASVLKVADSTTALPFNKETFFKKPHSVIAPFKRGMDVRQWLITFCIQANAIGWDRRDWPVKISHYLDVLELYWYVEMGGPRLDFDTIVDLMLCRFMSRVSEIKLYHEFLMAQQLPNEAVSAFATRLEVIARAIPGLISDEHLVQHFINNTLPDMSGSITWAGNLRM